MKRIIPPIFITLILIVISTGIIFYGRGYRADLKNKTLESKGLLVANSQPNGAQIFINDKLTSATNTTINLDPDWYNVKFIKEGYTTWQKKIRMQGEVVTKIDAILFPINPALSPLTVTGIANPTVSPNSDKIVFSISKTNNLDQQTPNGSGAYILNLSDGPLGINRNILQIAQNTSFISFEDAQFTWSPSGKQVLAQIDSSYYLLETDSLNSNPRIVTSLLTNILDEWEKEKQLLERERLETLKEELTTVLSSKTSIISWSPDETKILYEATNSATVPPIITPPLIGTNNTEEQRTISPNKVYVYDIKEDKNFFIMDKIADSPSLPIHWFPTSSHFLVIEEGTISVMDYDATNKVTLYAGPFYEEIAVPWPNGSKIVILTTLNPQPDAKPNLYAINIR